MGRVTETVAIDLKLALLLFESGDQRRLNSIRQKNKCAALKCAGIIHKTRRLARKFAERKKPF